MALLTSAIVVHLFYRRKIHPKPAIGRDSRGIDILGEEIQAGGYKIVHLRVNAEWVKREILDAAWSDLDIIAWHVASRVMPGDYLGYERAEWDKRERFNVWAKRRVR